MTNRLARARALIAEEPCSSAFPDTTEAHLRRICATIVRTLPASGAALTVITRDGSRGAAIASDERSKIAAELQVTIGEGPSIDAHAAGRPVLEQDLGAASDRWATFGPAARKIGIRAMFAFPLQLGASKLGVLEISRGEPNPLSHGAVDQASAFAQIAMMTLLGEQEHDVNGARAGGLDTAMVIEAELYQAQGMVKVQLGGSLDEAMVRLRAHAYATDQRLAAVAHEVVARRLRLDRDDL